MASDLVEDTSVSKEASEVLPAAEPRGDVTIGESPLASLNVTGPDVKESEDRVDESVTSDSWLVKLVGSSTPLFHTMTIHSSLGDTNKTAASDSTTGRLSAVQVESSGLEQFSRSTHAHFLDTQTMQLPIVATNIVDVLYTRTTQYTRLVRSEIDTSATSQHYTIVRTEIDIKLGKKETRISCVVLVPVDIMAPSLVVVVQGNIVKDIKDNVRYINRSVGANEGLDSCPWKVQPGRELDWYMSTSGRGITVTGRDQDLVTIIVGFGGSVIKAVSTITRAIDYRSTQINETTAVRSKGSISNSVYNNNSLVQLIKRCEQFIMLVQLVKLVQLVIKLVQLRMKDFSMKVYNKNPPVETLTTNHLSLECTLDVLPPLCQGVKENYLQVDCHYIKYRCNINHCIIKYRCNISHHINKYHCSIGHYVSKYHYNISCVTRTHNFIHVVNRLLHLDGSFSELVRFSPNHSLGCMLGPTLNKSVPLGVDILEEEVGSMSPPTDQVPSGSDSLPPLTLVANPEDVIVDDADRDLKLHLVDARLFRRVIILHLNLLDSCT